MKRVKGSVSVTALVTVSVLMILSLALINLIYFTMQNTQRELERNRGRWFLEGRVQEYFDAVISGQKMVQTGNSTIEENIDGQKISIYLSVNKKAEQLYQLTADMIWKQQFKSSQKIDFYTLNPFDYVLFFNKTQNIPIHYRTVISGKMAIKESLSLQANLKQNLGFYFRKSNPYPIEYRNTPPALDLSMFTNNLESESNDALCFDPAMSSGSLFKRNNGLENISLPKFQDVWNAYFPRRDEAWVLSQTSFFNTEKILNPLSSRKELLAFGNGVTTRFNLEGRRTQNVYIKKTKTGTRFQEINTMDSATTFGQQDTADFFRTNEEILTISASESPIMIDANASTLQNLGSYSLAGSYYSYISKDEEIHSVYLDKVSSSTLLKPGDDYEYDPVSKTLKITSKAYYRDHVLEIGRGDGRNMEFNVPSSGDRDVWVCFVDGRKLPYSIPFLKHIKFDVPPPSGSRITALVSPPKIFIRKTPPVYDTGVFLDITENVVILDLDKMHNFPKNRVIISYLPVLVRGSAYYPLAIISTENIYLENLNPGMKGEPVLFASGKGVWIYRRNSTDKIQVNKCLIITPLNGVYAVQENGNSRNIPARLYGSIVMTGENSSMAMEGCGFEKDYIYYSGIKDYFTRQPFNYFPYPFFIASVMRN